MTLRRRILPNCDVFYSYNKVLEICISIHSPFSIFSRKCSQLSKQDYKRYCSILQVPTNSTTQDVHNAFLKLAKRYHPDSGNEDANADKFKEIETAFRMLKNHPNMNHENEILKENPNDDKKHVAPQHRQYLSYDGVGYGTPYQRQQEYTKRRAMQATDNVLQHRLNKSAAEPEDKKLRTMDNKSYKYNHKIKTKYLCAQTGWQTGEKRLTRIHILPEILILNSDPEEISARTINLHKLFRYGIDRIVEDLIQESMSKGEFNNLPGSGKPLKLHQNVNPYVDFTTHKLNQVLIENGFTPEWITLQKDIREEITKLKRALAADRKRFSAVPLTDEETRRWDKCTEKYQETVTKINKKIQYYNLVVPILQKQMVTVNLKRLGKKIIEKGPGSSTQKGSTESMNAKAGPKLSDSGFFRFIGSFINLR